MNVSKHILKPGNEGLPPFLHDVFPGIIHAIFPYIVHGKNFRVTEENNKRITPSDADQRSLSVGQTDVEDQKDSRLQKPDGIPSGMLWGSIIHRAAELIVCTGSFTDESVQESCEQAVKEQIQSELLNKKQRKELALPTEAVTIEAIQADLIKKAASNKHMGDGPFVQTAPQVP